MGEGAEEWVKGGWAGANPRLEHPGGCLGGVGAAEGRSHAGVQAAALRRGAAAGSVAVAVALFSRHALPAPANGPGWEESEWGGKVGDMGCTT